MPDYNILMFQSTHPRGVRLTPAVGIVKVSGVSIHAPARGATIPIYSHFNHFNVSIHAPARGATTNSKFAFMSYNSFNPRTREGCDHLSFDYTAPIDMFQSTHPRGVRRERASSLAGSATFQSTHPRGVRHSDWVKIAERNMFQSTHPRGVRPGGKLSRAQKNMPFQSTHPRGVRHRLFLLSGCATLFQSTHPRGVRPASHVMPTS